MLAAIDSPGDDMQQQQQQIVERRSGNIRLPDFWPSAPAICSQGPAPFWSVRPSYREGYVCSCGHCLVTWRHAARHGPDHQDVYCIGTALKERLLLSHNLLLVQKAAKVLSMLAVWDRRPSQLLADLLEFCPPVEEISAFFRAIFVQRLTASVAEPVFFDRIRLLVYFCTGSGSSSRFCFYKKEGFHHKKKN